MSFVRRRDRLSVIGDRARSGRRSRDGSAPTTHDRDDGDDSACMRPQLYLAKLTAQCCLEGCRFGKPLAQSNVASSSDQALSFSSGSLSQCLSNVIVSLAVKALVILQPGSHSSSVQEGQRARQMHQDSTPLTSLAEDVIRVWLDCAHSADLLRVLGTDGRFAGLMMLCHGWVLCLSSRTALITRSRGKQNNSDQLLDVRFVTLWHALPYRSTLSPPFLFGP